MADYLYRCCLQNRRRALVKQSIVLDPVAAPRRKWMGAQPERPSALK